MPGHAAPGFRLQTLLVVLLAALAFGRQDGHRVSRTLLGGDRSAPNVTGGAGDTDESARLEEQAVVLARAVAAEASEFTSSNDQEVATAINEAATEARAMHHEIKSVVRAKLEAERAQAADEDERLNVARAAMHAADDSAEKETEADLQWLKASQADVTETAAEAEREAAALRMEAEHKSLPFLPGRASA